MYVIFSTVEFALSVYCSTQDAPAIDYLIKSYPEFVAIDSLPVEEGSTPGDKVTDRLLWVISVYEFECQLSVGLALLYSV